MGGVENVHRFAAPSAPPAADFVPAGISTEYLVAIGKRPAGSNSRVFVPSHRHLPGGCGESLTGTCEALKSSFDVTATIGCENVTLRCGAIGTSPSGETRKTSSGPDATCPDWFDCSAPLAGGKASPIVWPARGGGSERSRIAKSFSSSPSTLIGGNRLSRFSAPSPESGSVAGLAIRCCVCACPCSSWASLKRKTSPLLAPESL